MTTFYIEILKPGLPTFEFNLQWELYTKLYTKTLQYKFVYSNCETEFR